METSSRKLVRYYRPERYKGGGCHHIGIEIERTNRMVTVQDLARSRTFYEVPVADVTDVSDELKKRLAAGSEAA
jgi:hypothetical protein